MKYFLIALLLATPAAAQGVQDMIAQRNACYVVLKELAKKKVAINPSMVWPQGSEHCPEAFAAYDRFVAAEVEKRKAAEDAGVMQKVK